MDEATEEGEAYTPTAATRSGAQVPAAPIALRVLAYIADLCVAVTAIAIASIINVTAGLDKGWILVGAGAAVAIIASIVLHGVFGASPGKMLAGLKVVDAQSERRIGFPGAAIRSVVFNLLAPLVYLPGWSILADRDRRGIHEKASRSTVVDADLVASDADAHTDSDAAAFGGSQVSDPFDEQTGEREQGLQRIPTPLPPGFESPAAAASPAGGHDGRGTDVDAKTSGVRERLAPPELPPLPDDVPGLRPIPPRFGPPPTEGDAPAAPLPAPGQAPPPAGQPPRPPQPAPGPQHGGPQQFVPPRPSGPVPGAGVPGPGVGAPVPGAVPGPGPQPPRAGGQPPRPAAPTPLQSGGAPIVLRFDDGHSVDVRGDGIIGREPVIPQGGDSSKITKHVLVDDTASVSKTHLLFGITRGELWVEDVGSTNGSAIAFGDSWTELTKGVRYAVEKGSVVHMGQRSFRVFGG
ncbi:hypothetical protein GCM10027289_02540 [Tsukamurella serpentis]